MPINANVTNNQITASVSEDKIDATVSGGFGPSGAAGAAATITVGTVTTGAPGTSASVVNAGTSSAAVLNFTIPAGAAGATGPQGATGPAGTASWAGITDKPSTFAPSSHQHVAADISDFTSAVVAAAPPTTDASLLVQGTLPDARLSANIARTSDVSAAVAAVIDAAPASLDTLNELAAALGDDANFASTVTNALAGKAATSHTHGNITSDGKIGTASNRLVTTGSGGVLVASFRPDLDVDSLTATLGVSAHSVSTTGSGVTVTGGSIIQRESGTFVTQFNVSNAGIVTVGQWQATAIAVAYGGTGATTASAARTNLGLVIGTDVAAASHNQAWSTITSTPTTLAGYGITDAVASSDSRLTDARTPTAHKSTHATGGTDALSPADIGAATVSHEHSALAITSGVIDPARLGSGAASNTTFLRGDSSYAPVSEVYEFTRTSKPADATGSNGDYSWTIPANAKLVEFYAVGGGGGGGSGRRGAAGSARFGGGGAGSGGVFVIIRQVSELVTRSLSIEVGSGGTGGAAVTTNDTNGNSGTNGGDTRITIGSTILSATRGGLGQGGTNAAGTAGAGGSALYSGGNGSSSSVTAAPNTTNLSANNFAAAGAGAGGGISTGDVSYGGGQSRASINLAGNQLVSSSGGTAPGGAGQNASDAWTSPFANAPGGGGGGGAAGNSTTAGGNGGNGASVGGAGGGGGASFNGYNSGAGGNGAPGYVRVTVWY